MPSALVSFPTAITAKAIAVVWLLVVIIGTFVAGTGVEATSGEIIPIGWIQIRSSRDTFQMVLRDDADETVNEIVLDLADDSVAGALVRVQGLLRGHVLTIEPFGKTAGDAALYCGDSLLVLQPPQIGDCDTWILRLHVRAPQTGVTAVVADLRVEVEHQEAQGACETGTRVGKAPATSTFLPSRIVVRVKSIPVAHLQDEESY